VVEFFFLQLDSFLDSSNSHLSVFFQSVLCLKKPSSSFHLESKEELWQRKLLGPV
jgi:hypothetical protein